MSAPQSTPEMETPLDRVLDRLERVRAERGQWSARCPAHDDRDPSLSVGEGDDGRVLIYCHAGCSIADIVGALGLETRDLFVANERGPYRYSSVIAEYKYCDENGTILYVVERRFPKDFRQRRPDGAGGWIWKLEEVRRVPYRLTEVVDAVSRGELVVIVEGERDVDRLRAEGFVATCNSGGAGKWRAEFAQHFSDAKVAVIADNDQPGLEHASDVARSLVSVAAEVRVIELPGLPDKGDVCDWLGAGGTAEQLRELIASTPQWAGDATDAEVKVNSPADPFPNSGIFAEHLYAHPQRRLVVHEGGAFYTWNGAFWPEQPVDELKSQLWWFFDRCVYWDARNQEWVRFRPTRAKIENLIAALAGLVQEPEDRQAPTWFDQRSDGFPATEIIACGNGLLHVPTRTMIDHTPLFYIHHGVPFDYQPDAVTPDAWLQFLNDLWPDDAEACDVLQEMFGYLLVGRTDLQKMFLLVGPPRSGKGTIGRVLRGLAGHHNVAGPTLSSLGTNFGLAPLISRPIALIADARLRSDSEVVTERLLSISGEDTLTVDRKYRSAWTGRIPARIVIMTNELPRLGDASGALANRFIIVPFTRSFLGHEDPTLTDTLLTGLPGIFNWSLDGLDRLTDRGYFQQPDSGTETMRELETLGSPVKAFLDECCELDPNAEIPIASLYDAYRSWCFANGRRVPSTGGFGRDMHAALPNLGQRQYDRRRWYQGIRLLPRSTTRG